tara:strand:- start:1542 stop:2531 length:990 start_codon:yes stop_codon:yes gene_type:complete
MMRAGKTVSVLLSLAILLGLGIGNYLPVTSEKLGGLIDTLVICLLALLFFEVRLYPLRVASGHAGFLLLAWTANFVLIPVLGWGIASFLFDNQPMLLAGLLLYLLFPCTDWFLAFTRIAKGDVALGSILIPINLISQLLLFPFYLEFFIGSEKSSELVAIWGTLWQWFLLPLLAAVSLRFIIARVFPSSRFESISRFTSSMVPWILSALVCCIFSYHTPQLTAHPNAFPLILLAVFLFFALSSILSELLAWRFKLSHPKHVLLAMTTTARNSPLILGLATIALPDQPLVYAGLIIGMLVEFPHLTLLSRLLLRKDAQAKPSTTNPLTTR